MFKFHALLTILLTSLIGFSSVHARFLPEMPYTKEERMQLRHNDSTEDLSITDGIPLEKQQTEAINQLYEEYKQHLAENEAKMESIDQALFQEIISEQTDEQQIEHYADLKAKLTKEMAVIKTKTMHEIYNTLDADQQKTMRHNLSSNLNIDILEKRPLYKELLGIY